MMIYDDDGSDVTWQEIDCICGSVCNIVILTYLFTYAETISRLSIWSAIEVTTSTRNYTGNLAGRLHRKC